MLQRERAQPGFIIQRLFKLRLLYARLLRTTQHTPFCSYLFFSSSKTSPVISSKPSPLLCFLSWALCCPLFDTFSKWLHFSLERSALLLILNPSPALYSAQQEVLPSLCFSLLFCLLQKWWWFHSFYFNIFLLIPHFLVLDLFTHRSQQELSGEGKTNLCYKSTGFPTFLSSVSGRYTIDKHLTIK